MNKRPIDHAMESQRPEKVYIRKRWLAVIKAVEKKYKKSEIPLYLTLPGSDGYDIQMLIDHDLIELTDVKSVKEKDIQKVIAIEKNNKAVLNLQKKFIGLRIEEQSLESILKGVGLQSWPSKKEKEIFKAHIINLDFDGSLNSNDINGTVEIKEIEWINKICLIKKEQKLDAWTLFLTLNASKSSLKKYMIDFIRAFLNDNINRSSDFSDLSKKFLNKKIFTKLKDNSDLKLSDLSDEDCRMLFMVFIPKYISNKVHTEGWRLTTDFNLHYGDGKKRAPMVSWCITFTYDNSPTPNEIYIKSIKSIFNDFGFINGKGLVVK